MPGGITNEKYISSSGNPVRPHKARPHITVEEKQHKC